MSPSINRKTEVSKIQNPQWLLNLKTWGLPGGPVVESLQSPNAGDVVEPCGGTKIPHAKATRLSSCKESHLRSTQIKKNLAEPLADLSKDSFINKFTSRLLEKKKKQNSELIS